MQLQNLTNHNVLIGAGTTTITKVAPSATSGVPLISQGAAADPVFGTVSVAGGGTGATTLTGVLTGNGTSPMTASPVTQYAVVVGSTANLVNSVGPGSAGQVLQSGGAAANPAYSTATYPSTATNTGRILRADGTNWVETTATYPNSTTINQILYSSANNAITGLATGNTSVLVTGPTGVPSFTSLAADGQLLIGATGGTPAGATLTAGTGITITNAANSITISAAAATPLTFHTSSGDATPAANAVSILGVGSITTTGAGSTVSVQLTGLTNHNVLIGAGTTTITKVAPSATSGVPLISQGAAADPAFGTAVVAGGGTGNTTFTAYSVICAGTTSTGAFQNVSGVGTSGQILTSNGAGALPTWQTPSSSSGQAYYQQMGQGNPADATTYVWQAQGTITQTPLNQAASRIYMPISGTINKCYGAVTVAATLGTAENSTVFFRKNNTTDVNITTTLKLNTSDNAFSNTSVGLSVTAGDYVEVYWTTPTWATNPSTCRATLTFVVE